jgi:hypothetical protein
VCALSVLLVLGAADRAVDLGDARFELDEVTLLVRMRL